MLLVLSTFEKRRDAEKAAESLVKGKLAACVNLLPVKSTYAWKGKVVKSGETLLLIKCAERNYKKAENAIRGMNPYEVPEIIAIKVGKGLPAYLRWVERQQPL